MGDIDTGENGCKGELEDEVLPLDAVREQSLRAAADKLAKQLGLALPGSPPAILVTFQQQQQQQQEVSDDSRLDKQPQQPSVGGGSAEAFADNAARKRAANELADVLSDLSEGLTARDGETALTTAGVLLRYGQALLHTVRLEMDAFGEIIKQNLVKSLAAGEAAGPAAGSGSAAAAGASADDQQSEREKQEAAGMAQVVAMAEQTQRRKKVVDLDGVVVDSQSEEEGGEGDSGDDDAGRDMNAANVSALMEVRGNSLEMAYEVVEFARSCFEEHKGYESQVAAAYQLLGDFYHEAEDYESAMDAFREADALLEMLQPSGDAAVIDHYRRRAAVQQQLSDMALELKDNAGAVAHLETAKGLLAPALAAVVESSPVAVSIHSWLEELDECIEDAKNRTEREAETRVELKRLASESHQGFDVVEDDACGFDADEGELEVAIVRPRKRTRTEEPLEQ